MPIYLTGTLISQLRERIGLEREIILRDCDIDDSSLRRMENDKQHPRKERLASIIEKIKLPLEGFVYPLLDYQGMEVYILCDQLNQALDRGDVAEAEPLLDTLDTLPGFDKGACQQFKLSKRAQFWELLGKDSSQILTLIDEALRITYENFSDNDLGKVALILEEPALLHTRARVYMKDGNIEAAIKILERMKSSYIRMPETDKEKKMLFTPVLLSLAKCLLLTKDYYRALEICEIGTEFSTMSRQGQFNPDFEMIIAHAIHGLNRHSEIRMHLQHAYCGFVLLGEPIRAKEVLKQAVEVFGVRLNLNGTENLDFSMHYRIPYERGESVTCFSIGTMISTLRTRAGLPREQLCRGICDKTTMLRIEQDTSSEHIFMLEALLQRLGRDIGMYVNFFLPKDEFVAMQLREKIEELVAKQRFNKASCLLDELSGMEMIMKNNVVQQFVDMTRAILFAAAGNGESPEYRDMLLVALTVTCPDFDETCIERYNLSFYEITLINLLASYYANEGNLSRAVDIFMRLHRNINSKYYDEALKARFYSSVLFNYSSCLGRIDKTGQALQIIAEGDSFERIHGRLTMLAEFAFNKAYILHKLCRTDESIPYFTLSYHGVSMFTKYNSASSFPIIREFVKKNLELEFD